MTLSRTKLKERECKVCRGLYMPAKAVVAPLSRVGNIGDGNVSAGVRASVAIAFEQKSWGAK